MKITIGSLCASLFLSVVLCGCNVASETQSNTPSKAPLPDLVMDSYYAGQEDPAFSYFHHSSIQRFLTMWVKEETGDLDM